ncbi:hypothetical protein BU23DRAFT_604211 [Bimuria novae-zelandiae CBS 107.79]|uniref:F-box domain-containing protein n=1 Tax=Bimuria novae-zelandiae CBS 107.79 TaxID=1447943 RepID=A0A6A5UM40_9PLEO|nr:hypothetical protein BU23DRAFT_604211 [Bimuria novae-zelandiae CBS 107.79]
MHHLTTLPTELLLKTYEFLSSFVDAVALSTSCRKLRSLWVAHRCTILAEILPRQFECYADARRLLNKQRGWECEGRDKHEMGMRDLQLLAENARRVEEAILDIERVFIPVLRGEKYVESWGGKECRIYSVDTSHPASLTLTERARVFRAYYQVKRLMWCNEDAIVAEMALMQLRNLFYVNEMAHWVRTRCANWKLIYLVRASGRAIERLYQEQYGCAAPELRSPRDFERPVVLFFIWDCWQGSLESMVMRGVEGAE